MPPKRMATTASGSVGVALLGGVLSVATATAAPALPASSPAVTTTPGATSDPTPAPSPGLAPGAAPGLAPAAPGLAPAARPGSGLPASSSRTLCKVRTFYRIRSHTTHDFWIPRSHYIDGPGGQMTAWVKRWHTVEARVKGGREVLYEFRFPEFLKRARKEVVRDLARFHTIEFMHQYFRPIRDGKYGHMRYRVFGHRIRFQQWRRARDCGMHRIGFGIADVPTGTEGWKYWETDCPYPGSRAAGPGRQKQAGSASCARAGSSPARPADWEAPSRRER
jgi:hypothetical protein